MQEKKEAKERQEREARAAAGEETPPDWNMSSSSSSSSAKSKKKPNKAVDKTAGPGTPAAGSEHGSFVKREPGVSSGALDKKAPLCSRPEGSRVSSIPRTNLKGLSGGRLPCTEWQ